MDVLFWLLLWRALSVWPNTASQHKKLVILRGATSANMRTGFIEAKFKLKKSKEL
jgi:hypothetical protein